MKYQIVVLTDSGKTATAEEWYNVTADRYTDAMQIASDLYGNLARVYPLAVAGDGDSVMELARFTMRSVERWERRNDSAVMKPQNRTDDDRNDLVSVACLAILTALRETSDKVNMFDLKKTAFTAITTAQKQDERKRAAEYMPGWATCNISPREARATYPELDALIREAIDTADMTDRQQTALEYMVDGLSTRDIAEHMGISSPGTVHQTISRALHAIMTNCIDIDPAIFGYYGFTADDVLTALATLRKQGRMDTRHR